MSHHYSGPDLAFPHGDARLDYLDLYVFPKPNDGSKSILIMDAHPSIGVNPPGPTTTEPFATNALYELMIDTNGDAVADTSYSVRFAASKEGSRPQLSVALMARELNSGGPRHSNFARTLPGRG
jgi:hypothetical protein